MAYEENRTAGDGEHRLVLEGREQLTVTGVEEVESFDEKSIVMGTSKGVLVVRGEQLHIEQLSLDGGALKVEGYVDSITYEEERTARGGGLLARLLGG